jgi:hypothetical protein
VKIDMETIMEIYTLAARHDYDMPLETAAGPGAVDTPPYSEDHQGITAAFNCAGTAGTFGTAGGCIGTFGSFGSANCVKLK